MYVVIVSARADGFAIQRAANTPDICPEFLTDVLINQRASVFGAECDVEIDS